VCSSDLYRLSFFCMFDQRAGAAKFYIIRMNSDSKDVELLHAANLAFITSMYSGFIFDQIFLHIEQEDLLPLHLRYMQEDFKRDKR